MRLVTLQNVVKFEFPFLCRSTIRQRTMHLSSGYDTSSSANRMRLLGKENITIVIALPSFLGLIAESCSVETKRNESTAAAGCTKNLATIKVPNQINLILTPVKLSSAAAAAIVVLTTRHEQP